MGGPFGQWAHQYDVPPRTQSGEGGMVAQSNKYPGSICGLRPIFVLFSHLFPMWGQQTDRPGHSLLRCHAFLPFFNQETRDSFLSYWFSPFQPRCGFDAYSLGQYSLPSFPYSTQTWISLHEVGFPLIVQIMVFVCVASRAEDSKLGRWWSGKRSTCSDVADGAIEQGYGSKRGSIPEGRREVASLVVIVLHTHYDSELGDGGHPARALGLRGRPCRQCVTSLADDECVNAARPFLPRRICDHWWGGRERPYFLDLERGW